jgi:lysozyme
MTIIPNVLDLFHGDNREDIPDFVALRKSGIKGIIHKLTQGSNYFDPKCLPRLRAAHAAGLLLGVYHFGDGSPTASQAHLFIVHCRSLDLPIGLKVLDWENNTFQMTAAQAAVFLHLLKADGDFTALYASNLAAELKPPYRSILAEFPLWHAEYGPANKIPPPWTQETCIGWQYSESGSVRGISGHVDLNVFSDDFLAKWSAASK